LSRKLDNPLEYYSAEDIFKEMTSNMPLYAGIKSGYRWPCPTIAAEVKGKFVPFNTEVDISGEGTITLIVGKTMGHSGSYTTWAAGPMTVLGSQALRINPEEAAKMDIADGDLVTISSPQGNITVKATLTEAMPPGVVFLADHFADPMANTLTLNSNLCRVNIQKG
jgi:anaerobic selenocysteine-containing dehydrogenase